MNRQKSYDGSSILYLVATPIGNLGDFSKRAIEILNEVDFIFCEDTRVTSKLMNHFEIKKKLYSYHEHNKVVSGEFAIKLLKEGNSVALVSDAGYPAISDPGYELVKSAIEEDINVVNIPGANALLSAIVVSGLVPQPFTFIGFLDNKEGKRKKQLEVYKDRQETLVLYESPHRITKTLNNILELYGDREVSLSREITKKFEEVIRGKVSELVEVTDSLKGEMVLVVSGKKEEFDMDSITVIDQIENFIKEGFSEKDAIKKTAKLRNTQKNKIYIEYHEYKNKKETD